MTTVTAPMIRANGTKASAPPSVLRVPTPTEVWRVARMDPSVARTLIICAAIVAGLLIAAFAVVAVMGGEVVGVATALSVALGAIGLAIARYRWGNSSGG